MLAAAIAKHLAAEVDGLTFDASGAGGNVFVSSMPSTPDVAVAIMPTGGQPNLTRDPHDRPTIQVLVRGPRFDSRPAWQLASAIYSQLACLRYVTLDDGGPDEIYLVGCTALQSAPVGIGQDPNQRHEYSLNFVCDTVAPTDHRSPVNGG